MANLLRGKLVVYRDQRIQTYDDSHLSGKKQFAFYFAARVDPACQKFTPLLAKFYGKYAATHPEFELVFISKDFSSLEMETDVRAYDMPWPVLDYPRLSEEKNLAAAGDGPLPRLFVVDGTGHLLLDSGTDGPKHVLDVLSPRPAARARRTLREALCSSVKNPFHTTCPPCHPLSFAPFSVVIVRACSPAACCGSRWAPASRRPIPGPFPSRTYA